MSDPLRDLAPFLEQARSSQNEFTPPDYLTVRLMHSRGSAIEPAVAPLPEELELPRSFGPYMLESVLGRGGAGTVYQAYDAELERSIAVKVLSSGLINDREAGVRFLREARAMAKLSDDHLMPLLAVHQETPAPCFTMPLLAGETLHDRIRREGTLSCDEAVRLAEQICAGLATAHEADLVHRDLKPSNIFLEETEEGPRARLMDFGLVKAAEDPSMTREGELAGTPSFMAPEQIDGVNVDGRSDLFGLGATIFMCLTGRPPFEGETLTATFRKIASEDAPALAKVAPETPGWLSGLVAELLSKKVEERPRSARLVMDRLRERRPSATATGGLIQRRWLVGALAAAVIFSLVIWFSSEWFQSQEQREDFDFVKALASLESGDSWNVPAGTIFLESLDLEGKDLRMEGSAEGTRLVFVKLEGPAIVNAGNLELVNLTIDCSRLGEGETVPLIQSQGELVTLTNCRVEQKQSSSEFPGSRTLIEAAADSRTVLDGCELYTFQSIIWRMKGAASLLVKDSLVVSPGISFSATEDGSQGEVVLKGSTCIQQVVFSHFDSSDDGKSIDIVVEDSLVESNHALIWLPLGDEETLRAGLDFQAGNSLFLLDKNLLNTSTRPRIISRRQGTIDAWHPDQWSDYWGGGEKEVTYTKGSIFERDGITDRMLETLKANDLIAAPRGFKDLGVDLKSVGPSK
ncbi:MAG: serine/threonine-protein kinase [Roseibacillus sp.]